MKPELDLGPSISFKFNINVFKKKRAFQEALYILIFINSTHDTLEFSRILISNLSTVNVTTLIQVPDRDNN